MVELYEIAIYYLIERDLVEAIDWPILKNGRVHYR
jgi:hypothetical protein